MKYEGAVEQVSPKVLMVSGKEFLHQIIDEEVNFSLIDKQRVIITSTKLTSLAIEIHELLNEFTNIVMYDLLYELPPIRSINHHIDLILGVSLPNKVAYRMTPRENKDIKNQVQELLDKGIVKEILSPYTESKEGWKLEDVYRFQDHQ